MKFIIFISFIFSTSFFAIPAHATGYKVCYFHDVEYAYIPQTSQCPWNQTNLPPESEDIPPGQHDSLSPDKKRIIHSPECFGEHNGGMN